MGKHEFDLKWAEGLEGPARRVGEVLLAAEPFLSDGFGYYTSIAEFQALCWRIAEAARA